VPAPRKKPAKPPVEVSAAPLPWGRVFDWFAFRALGGWVIVQEVGSKLPPDKWTLATGVALFFIPDWLRGSDSAVLRTIRAVFGRQS
jgi:hypothetical protein